MGLTKRKDGYYVEFPVCEREGLLKLVRGGRIKRWKVGQTTRHMARQHEALIEAELLKGLKAVKPDSMPTFRAWATEYLNLEATWRRQFRIVSRSSIAFANILAISSYLASPPRCRGIQEAAAQCGKDPCYREL